MQEYTLSLSLARTSDMAKRLLLILILAVMLSLTLAMVAQPVTVYAAPETATSGQQDRRPDRERPVKGTTSTPKGDGSTQQGGSSTTKARPRLVRR